MGTFSFVHVTMFQMCRTSQPEVISFHFDWVGS